MLKLLQIVFASIVIALSAYGLISRDYNLNFLMVFILTLGIEEFQRERKVYGWLLMGLFLFSVYVSIQSFVLI